MTTLAEQLNTCLVNQRAWGSINLKLGTAEREWYSLLPYVEYKTGKVEYMPAIWNYIKNMPIQHTTEQKEWSHTSYICYVAPEVAINQELVAITWARQPDLIIQQIIFFRSIDQKVRHRTIKDILDNFVEPMMQGNVHTLQIFHKLFGKHAAFSVDQKFTDNLINPESDYERKVDDVWLYIKGGTYHWGFELAE